VAKAVLVNEFTSNTPSQILPVRNTASSTKAEWPMNLDHKCLVKCVVLPSGTAGLPIFTSGCPESSATA
jgi:hypothetical protein